MSKIARSFYMRYKRVTRQPDSGEKFAANICTPVDNTLSESP